MFKAVLYLLFAVQMFDSSQCLETLDHVRITNSIRRAIEEAKRQRNMEHLTRFVTEEYQSRIEVERRRADKRNSIIRAKQAVLQGDFNKVRAAGVVAESS